MTSLIDIGVNLTGRSFSADLDAVIQRAQNAGVAQMIVTGTSVDHSQQAVELVKQYPDILYTTVGVHPHHAKECNDQTLGILEQLAQQTGVVAIGECGLDFNRNYSPPEIQEQWFEAQLELASGLGLPVFLHQRDAHERFLALLGQWRPRLSDAVAHCFTGDTEQARAYLDLDLHIGITGWICDERRGGDVQAAVSIIPDERLMIETDAPYLLPRDIEPKPKDRRNEPMYLPHVCQAVAAYRNQSPEHVASITRATAQRFFRLGTL